MALSHPMSFVLQNTIKFIGLEKNGCLLQLSIYHAPPHLGRLRGVVGETLFPKGRRVSLRSLRKLFAFFAVKKNKVGRYQGRGCCLYVFYSRISLPFIIPYG
jgi:hypothetical protein